MNAVLISLAMVAGATDRAIPTDYPTLQAAIAASGDGDVLRVAPGDYSSEPALAIHVSLTVIGGGAPQDTVLPPISVTDAALTVTDATFSCSSEGVVRGLDADVTLQRVQVGPCTLYNHRGVLVRRGSLLVEDSAFSKLFGLNGAAIQALGAQVMVRSSTFDDLTSSQPSWSENCTISGCGGAIYGGPDLSQAPVTLPALEVEDSSFTHCRAIAGGGAIFAAMADLVAIRRSQFQNNQADIGSDIRIQWAHQVRLQDLDVRADMDSVNSSIAVDDQPVNGTWAGKQADVEIDGLHLHGVDVPMKGLLHLSSLGSARLTRSIVCSSVVNTSQPRLVFLDHVADTTLDGVLLAGNTALTLLDATTSPLRASNVSLVGSAPSALRFSTQEPTIFPRGYLDSSLIAGRFQVGVDTQAALVVLGHHNDLWLTPSGPWILPTASGPIDTDGLEVDPDLVELNGYDLCYASTLWLAPDSPLRDAGDPSRTDPDGSPADIGAFGGPHSPLPDQDGDGSYVDLDCDDEDPARAPHLVDIPDDGIDQDCDGVDAEAPPPDTDTDVALDTAPPPDSGVSDVEEPSVRGCHCGTPSGQTTPTLALMALLVALRRRTSPSP